MLLKLAIQNIKGSKGFFFAYALTIGVLFTIIYNLTSVQDAMQSIELFKDAGVTGFKVGDVFDFLKNFMYVVIIFFVAYISRFFIKRRNREIALLKTLGLTRQSIWSMFLIENLIIIFGGVLIGLGLGIISSRLFSSVAMSIMGFKLENSGFNFSASGLGDILIIMIVVYIIMAIIPIKAIAKSSITTLLGEQVAIDVVAKRPTASFILFVLSTAFLIFQALFVMPKGGLAFPTIILYLLTAIVVAITLYRGFVLNYFFTFKNKGKGISKPVKEMAFSHLGASVKGLYKMMAFITVMSAVVTVVITMTFGFFDGMMAQSTETIHNPLMIVANNQEKSDKYAKLMQEQDINTKQFTMLNQGNVKYSENNTEATNEPYVTSQHNLMVISQSTYNDFAKFRGLNTVDSNVSNVDKTNCSTMKNYCNLLSETKLDNIKYDGDILQTLVMGSGGMVYFNGFEQERTDRAKAYDNLVDPNIVVLKDSLYNKLNQSDFKTMYVASSDKPATKSDFFKYNALIEKTNLLEAKDILIVDVMPLIMVVSNVAIGLFQLIFLLMSLVTAIALMMSIFFRTLENMEKGTNEYVIAKQIGLSKTQILKATVTEALLSQFLPFALGVIVSLFLLHQMVYKAMPEGESFLNMIFQPSNITILGGLFAILIILVIILVVIINKRINQMKQVH